MQILRIMQVFDKYKTTSSRSDYVLVVKVCLKKFQVLS